MAVAAQGIVDAGGFQGFAGEGVGVMAHQYGVLIRLHALKGCLPVFLRGDSHQADAGGGPVADQAAAVVDDFHLAGVEDLPDEVQTFRGYQILFSQDGEFSQGAGMEESH